MTVCQPCYPDCLRLQNWGLGLGRAPFSERRGPSEARGRVSTTDSPAIRPPFPVRGKTGHPTGLVCGPAAVPADCSEQWRTRGSDSDLYAPACPSLTWSAVASSASPRDAPLRVSQPAGLEAAAVIALQSVPAPR